MSLPHIKPAARTLGPLAFAVVAPAVIILAGCVNNATQSAGNGPVSLVGTSSAAGK